MSKLSKFRSSPMSFFADSKHRALRALGSAAGPSILQREGLLAFLESPLDAAAESGLSVLEPLARRALRRAAERRRRVLAAAPQTSVSVIMPALNAEKKIERSIRSLLDQTHQNLDVVVVDDASDDRTADMVRAVADPRVQLVENATRRGAARARNVGLEVATGSYITFQDADDFAHTERIERQLAALIETNASICVCNAARETDDGKRVIINGRRFSKIVISMMIPRDPVFNKIGYMMDLRTGEDSEYYERAKAVFGENCEVHLFQTLIRAGFSPDSLMFSHGQTVVLEDGHVDYVPREDLRLALDDALARIEKIRRGQLTPYVAMN